MLGCFSRMNLRPKFVLAAEIPCEWKFATKYRSEFALWLGALSVYVAITLPSFTSSPPEAAIFCPDKWGLSSGTELSKQYSAVCGTYGAATLAISSCDFWKNLLRSSWDAKVLFSSTFPWSKTFQVLFLSCLTWLTWLELHQHLAKAFEARLRIAWRKLVNSRWPSEASIGNFRELEGEMFSIKSTFFLISPERMSCMAPREYQKRAPNLLFWPLPLGDLLSALFWFTVWLQSLRTELGFGSVQRRALAWAWMHSVHQRSFGPKERACQWTRLARIGADYKPDSRWNHFEGSRTGHSHSMRTRFGRRKFGRNLQILRRFAPNRIGPQELQSMKVKNHTHSANIDHHFQTFSCTQNSAFQPGPILCPMVREVRCLGSAALPSR